MGKRPVISDVAKLAHVSEATVSHVINETRFVEEQTRQRVLDAIAELGYRPSSAARSLTTKRSKTVGVLLANATNPYFGQVLAGIEETLLPERYGLMVSSSAETLTMEAVALELLLYQQVDGLIVAGISNHWDPLLHAEHERLPMVFVDRQFEGMSGPFVGTDFTNAACMATEYFIQHGHRHIALVAGMSWVSATGERIAGFLQALEDHHIPAFSDAVNYCEATPDAARKVVSHLLSHTQRPTALLINNQTMTLGALQAISALGLRCPQDVSLIGFDDNPWWELTNPPITAMRQPARQMGELGAAVLLSLMRGEEPPSRRIILPCEFILRQSVAPPPE
jgi:LacI family transcriptional regulator